MQSNPDNKEHHVCAGELVDYFYNQVENLKPSSHSMGRDGTRRKDRREATGRSDGVQCEHQERERNRTTVQIGKRREELDRSNFIP